jgi:hypothetical protein
VVIAHRATADPAVHRVTRGRVTVEVPIRHRAMVAAAVLQHRAEVEDTTAAEAAVDARAAVVEVDTLVAAAEAVTLVAAATPVAVGIRAVVIDRMAYPHDFPAKLILQG